MSKRTISCVQSGCEALLFQTLKTPIVYIAPSNQDIYDLERQVRFFTPDQMVYTFPAWDCLPYDRLSPSAGIVGMRFQACNVLRHRSADITLVSAPVCLQYLPPLDGQIFTFQVRQEMPRSEWLPWLVAHGYEQVNDLFERGQFSMRGSVVDIFATHEAIPYRLDFFGDTLEYIKTFSLETQKPIQTHTTLTLFPAREVPASTDAGAEHCLANFYPNLTTLEAYIPKEATIVAHTHALDALKNFHEQIHDYYSARSKQHQEGVSFPYTIQPPERLYQPMDQVCKPHIILTPFKIPKSQDTDVCDSKPVPTFFLDKTQGDSLTQVCAFIKKQRGKRVVISCRNERATARMEHIFKEYTTHIPHLTYAMLGLEHGFVYQNTVVITERDIFGDQIIAHSSQQRIRRAAFFDLATLTRGDLIVHAIHGIGVFKELVTLEVQKRAHDFFLLTYEGDDKLYLPVENADLLSRYGGSPENSVLDKLGSPSFRTRAMRLKTALKDIAQELVTCAAKRKLKTAEVFKPPLGMWEEFCARFPFVETEDQDKAIEDILGDLEHGYPMDRLICGDVGFGKTEVAMRAAMIVASSGGQVAVITPTTILARQHTHTFTERFKDTPLHIAGLSRLTPTRQAQEVRENLRQGHIDIIIGTHALLSKNIAFKNLALLIIDEEQHFGVTHKEKLKSLAEGVHVLTLTATPIPRTLQMSFSGIKDLSILATPPVDRLLTHTYVTPFDELIVSQALMREKNRNGQSFYVIPRIADIAEVESFLRRHTPNLRFISVHGQMAPTHIDAQMNAFCDGAYDVLVSTSIIESGLDIPQVNTIIVHHSHMFGLSQLYQLRGRVGRSHVQAYCYFTIPEKSLEKRAAQRLKMLQSLDILGSGFMLASHDLDMRGAGNIVGQQQSGHMKDVGCELYQTMLEEAMRNLKEEGTQQEQAQWSVTIQLDMPVLLPESYVPDVQERIRLYRQLSHAESAQTLNEIRERMENRFGQLCQEAAILIKVTMLRNTCKKANVHKISADDQSFSFFFKDNACHHTDKLFELMAHGKLKITANHCVRVPGKWPDNLTQLDAMITFLEPFAP